MKQSKNERRMRAKKRLEERIAKGGNIINGVLVPFTPVQIEKMHAELYMIEQAIKNK